MSSRGIPGLHHAHPVLPYRTCIGVQDNYFFDGPNRELNSRRVVLRLRTYNGDQKATITLKVWGRGGGLPV